METLLSRYNGEDMVVIAAIAHGIWTRKNHVVHGGKFAHPNFIVKEAEEWISPPPGRLKANWDVALNADGKRVATGVIIRDDKGLVIAALSRTVEACLAPVTAKAMGMLQATEFCQDLRMSDIVLEGDSLQGVQAVNAKGDQWLQFGQIIADIQVVLSQFRRCEVLHAKREANFDFAAHGLAKVAAQEPTEKIWKEDIHLCILM
ncbi:uncharacterized protein LOC132162842 [Corylus avellana]|uniref:uncharacterized protein LOC132162842 n=1 Tax=Corylus avellana TaxID=13451 RepID=UPI00286C1645|nr:uncharacterized protein LOC132162842 [Corylus avellana]